MNDLRMKLVDLETRSYKGGNRESNSLSKRIQDVRATYRHMTNTQLENELEERERELAKQSRVDRNLERQMQALESELETKEKARARLEQDLQRTEEKNVKLRQVIDEMMSESTTPTKLGRFASTRSGR